MSDPIAFMVMPFNIKQTLKAGDDIPPEVDFNAVWHRVHQPLLNELGFQAIRADSDLGGLVVVQMIQRLALADVVVADVTLANSNVYYEVGVRHAAQKNGCVLLSATWAEPVFDLSQIRRLEYPLSDGYCGEQAAEAAKSSLRGRLASLLQGSSPVFEALPGYPEQVDRRQLAPFLEAIDSLSQFEIDVYAIRMTSDREEARARTRELLARHGAKPVIRESVVLELIALVRDHLDWTDMLDYISTLPASLQQHPPVVEQRQLALAKTGKVTESAAALDQLIDRSGGSSERFGLLGGRYKQLMWAAHDGEKRKYLHKAIAAYEKGMMLDLNDYYPSSNLPRLYRLRGKEGDEKRAMETAIVAMMACRASMEQTPTDEWAKLTLLGAAFDRGDVDQARQLVDDMELENIAIPKIEATVPDLNASLDLHEEPTVRAGLEEVLVTVRAMMDR